MEMKNPSAEKIVKKADDKMSGGRVELEGGLLIIKKGRDSYEIYHPSYVRGGNYTMMTIKKDKLGKLIDMNEKYLQKKQNIENLG